MIRYARWIYAGWLVLTSLAIVVQLYLAGYGVFGFNGLNGFQAHLLVGDLIGIAILVSLGLAFAARVAWKLTIANAVLLLLMAIQFVLAHTGVQAVSAFHVVNGVLIFVLTLYLTQEAVRVVMKDRTPARRSDPVSVASSIKP